MSDISVYGSIYDFEEIGHLPSELLAKYGEIKAQLSGADEEHWMAMKYDEMVRTHGPSWAHASKAAISELRRSVASLMQTRRDKDPEETEHGAIKPTTLRRHIRYWQERHRKEATA